MAVGQKGKVWPVPKKNSTRELPQDLRADFAVNLSAFMNSSLDLKTSRQLAKRTGLGRRTIERYLKMESPVGIDELQVLSTALDVAPWLLLRKMAVSEQDMEHRARLLPRTNATGTMREHKGRRVRR